jgi:hypothetical protein
MPCSNIENFCLHYKDQLASTVKEIIAKYTVGIMQSYWMLKYVVYSYHWALKGYSSQH